MVQPIVDPFVGRATELRLIRHLLQVVTGGVGRLLLISGEPGIGKSRFAAEASSLAAEAELEVYSVECVEGFVAPPLWPWRTLLGTDSPSDTAEGSSPDLYTFYSSVLAPVVERSRRTPVVLCIDDLHWADADSLRLLQFAAHVLARERIFIVCAYCNSYHERSPAFGPAVGSLLKEPSTVAIHLQPLDRRAIEEYCRHFGIVESAHVQLAESLTDGVPLYLKAVSQWDGERRTLEGLAGTCGRTIDTPVELRHVLEYRLRGLSPETRDILETAALLGEEVEPAILSEVSGRPREAILDALGEAARRDIVEISSRDSGETEVRFFHALIRHAVADTIPVASRFSRHVRVFEALTRCYGDRAREHSEELLYHARRSGGAVPSIELARLASVAGHAALRAVAPDEAARLFRFGLDELSSHGSAPKETAAALYEGLACALYLLAPERTDAEADEHLKRAMRLYCDLADRTAIRRLLPLAYLFPFRAAESDVAERLLELYPEYGAERGLVLLYAAVARYSETRVPEPALTVLQPVLSVERDSSEIRARAHYLLAAMYHWDGQYEKQLAHLDSAIADARQIGEQSLAMNCRQQAATVRARLGRPERESPVDPESRVAFTGSETATIETELDRRWRAFKGLGPLVLNCRWPEVFAALRTARFTNPAEETTFVRSRAATTYSLTGRFEEAREVINRLFGSRRYFAALWALNSSLDYWLASGDLRYAERILQLCAQLCSSPPYDRRTGAFARGHGALYRVLLGRVDEAQQLFDAKDVSLLDAGSLVLGIAARYINHIDLSVELLDLDSGLPAPPYHAGFRKLHCALSLVNRSGGGDRERARTLLAEALGDAGHFSMPPLAAQVRSALESLEGRPVSPASGVARAMLTRREVEVLSLVAAGHSDKEIGAELSIGAKTVSNYVSTLLRKSHCGNRTELARWALDHGLAE